MYIVQSQYLRQVLFMKKLNILGYNIEYFTVGRLRYEPPIGYSNISLSLYLEAELIAGTGLKTYQFLKGKQGLISPKELF